MRVLVVDADALTTELVEAAFQNAGWHVELSRSAERAQQLLRRTAFHVVVLDIELPYADGFAVLEMVRALTVYVPVIMLTARSGPEAVVKALQAGADDYVVKPFDVSELVARVQAVVRRTAQQQEILQLGDLTFNRLLRETLYGGRRIRLTPKEQTFLEQLLLNPGKPVSRATLLQKVWRINFDPESNLLDTLVARLRNKLRTARTNVVIVTHRNEGFSIELLPRTSPNP